MSELERDLAGRIYRIMHQPHDESNVRWLVEHSFRYASAYLDNKASVKQQYIKMLHLTKGQLTWDCIADMFRRDEHGHFPEFHRFFSGKSLYQSAPVEVETMMRCFVFNHVNDRLFQLLRENDPELGKITRNIKNAVRGSDRVYLTQYEGSTWMVLKSYENREFQSYQLPPEHFEALLTGKISAGANIPDHLQACIEVLETADCRPAYPVIGLAVIIRSYNYRYLETDTHISSHHPDPDSKDIIDNIVYSVQSSYYNRYVKQHNIDKSIYTSYFECIREIMYERLESDDATKTTSLFDKLCEKLVDVDRSDYISFHKSKMEYLYRKVNQQIESFLKKEGLIFSKTD